MGNPTYIQLKDKNGANIFEMKADRWEATIDREVKVHPLKSGFSATTVNAPLALDFGSATEHFALKGRLMTQRELNRLKDLVKNKWFTNSPVTLTIGTGGTAITKGGVVSQMHSYWDENTRKFVVTVLFIDTTVWKI